MNWLAKKVFDGGGKDLKNRYKSYSCLYKFLNITKNFIKKIIEELKRKPLNGCTKKYCSSGSIPDTEKNTARSGSLPSRCLSDRCTRNTASRYRLVNENLTFAAYDRIGGAGPLSTQVSYNRKPNAIVFLGKLRLRASNCGSILIEFAICMPILIILLFYINDLVKIKRYYSQTEFVGQQVANILQNISQKRTNKEIKQNDITNAFCLAFLSIYPGKTMFRVDSKLQFAHTPAMYVYRIKGKNGAASCSWYARVFLDKDYCTDPANVHFSTAPNPTNSGSTIQVVKAGQNKNPADIWPTLKIADGEEKIIIETKIERNPSQYKNMSGQTLSNKQALGFLLLDPKYSKNGQWNQLFHSVVIFTPKPGLFSETAPSQ